MWFLKDYLPDGYNFYLTATICSMLIYILIIRKYFQYRDITTKMKTFYGWPLVGKALQIFPFNKLIYKLGSYLNESLTFFTWLGMTPLIVTIEPEVIKHILISDEFLNKANVIHKSLDRALPNGLITSKLFKWKHNRKLLNSSFSPQILQRFIPIFLRNTEKICKHFDLLQDGQEHSIFQFLQNSILEVGMESIMGIELKTPQTLSSEMIANLHCLMDKICIDSALSPLKLGFLARDSAYYKALEYLHTFLNNFIAQKSLRSSTNEGSEFFLNRILQYEKQGHFHPKETIIQTYTMISGTFETTSTTLFSIIAMLAMHPDVQEKLYQNVLQVIPAHEQIAKEHLDQLPYLNMVISETLRLVPPIPFIGRQTIESCQLNESVFLPRDFQVLISVFHLHRCKKFWGSNAEKFNPDNFLSEAIEKRHPYAYIPFSKGVRNCIGWRYAGITLKFLLLAMVRKYKFSTTFLYDDLYFVPKVTLEYHREPKIQITKRL